MSSVMETQIVLVDFVMKSRVEVKIIGEPISNTNVYFSVAIALCSQSSEEDSGLWHVYFDGSDLFSRRKKKSK